MSPAKWSQSVMTVIISSKVRLKINISTSSLLTFSDVATVVNVQLRELLPDLLLPLKYLINSHVMMMRIIMMRMAV